MKTNLRHLLAFFSAAASLAAAPLTSTTAVHARPDSSAPAIAVLKAGAEPVPATDSTLPVPAGWQAVELDGPHEVYVHGKDLTKNLDVKPGAEFRIQPKTDAPVLTTFAPGDNTEITGLSGRWTQMKLQKKITGYIHSPGAAGATASANAPVAAPAHATPPPTTNAPAASVPAPAPTTVSTGGAPGRPAERSSNLNDGGSSALPRLFKGQLVASRKLLGRSPFEFQLNDDGGARYAYLDTSKLLLTEQIDKYIDRTVVVYGTARPVPNSKDIVIQVESLQLQ